VSLYLALKTLHILSAAVLFGTGLGIAYFMWSSHRSRDLPALRVTTRRVVLADWLFTAPAVVVQPVTGIWLMQIVGYRADTPWFRWVMALYAVAGVCWVPVVVIQYRLRALAAGATDWAALPADYHRLVLAWLALGVPAFSAVLGLYALMVVRPGL
jgi:uncharacterized membrane protein